MSQTGQIDAGDIAWADLGKIPGDEPSGECAHATDKVMGHEQGGRRPCIVISSPVKRKSGDEPLEIAIVVPLTATKRTWWTVVEVEDPTVLNKESYALCHNVRAISFERVERKVGPLTQKLFTKVRLILREVLEL